MKDRLTRACYEESQMIVMGLRLNLKTRLLIAYAVFMLITVVVAILSYSYFVLPGYVFLEHQEATHHVQRLVSSIDREIDSLNTFTMDYAHWDDSCDYIQTAEPAYIESNYVDQMLVDNHLSYVGIYDLTGSLLYGKRFDLVAQTQRPLIVTMYDNVLKIYAANYNRSLSGLFQSDDGLQMVAVRSIKKSDGSGEAFGTILFCRPLDTSYINNLARRNRLDIGLVSIAGGGQRHILEQITADVPVYIDEVSSERLDAFTKLSDLEHQPVVLLQVHLSRYLYMHTRTTMVYASSLALVAIMLLALFMGTTVRHMVMQPFKQLSHAIYHFRHSGDTVLPISLPSTGEMGGLVQEFRLLLTDLEESRVHQNFTREKSDLIKRVVPSAIFTVDRDKVITSWNKRAELITGYSATEMIGSSCFLFAKAPCQEHCGLFDSGQKKPITGRECTIRHKNGSVLTISKNADYLRDEHGEIAGGIECFEDVTERKRFEEALKWEVALNSRLALLSQSILQYGKNEIQVAEELLDYARNLTGSSEGFVAERLCNEQQVLWSSTQLFDDIEIKEGFRTIFALATGRGSLLHAVYDSTGGVFFNSLEKLHVEHLAAGVTKGIKHFMAVPVTYGGQVIGQVALANKDDGYSTKEVQAVEQLAELFALVLAQSNRSRKADVSGSDVVLC